MNQLTQKIESWDYKQSIEKFKPIVYKWKNMTLELVQELYIANGILDGRGGDRKSVSYKSKVTNVTFENYCNEIGLHIRTAYRWLETYDPDRNKLLTTDEVEQKKFIESREKQSEQEKKRSLINEYIKTGVKPKEWDPKYETEYKRIKQEDEDRTARIEQLKENERLRIEQENNKQKESDIYEHNLSDETQKHIDNLLKAEKEKNDIKIKIGMAHNDESKMIDVIHDYILALESDTIRLQTLHNIIKYCKNLANTYQIKSIE